MKMNKKERKILEEKFSIYEDENGYELEDWTSGGVDMIIYLHKEDDRFNSITEQFRYYVESFDIDEEIDIHRQAEDYRNAFSCRESVRDFEDWAEYIEDIAKELEKVGK